MCDPFSIWDNSFNQSKQRALYVSFEGCSKSIALGQGMFFSRTSLLELHHYSHSDWLDAPIPAVPSAVIDSLITRRSKKLSIIACSIYEVEYRALTSAT
ncbi:hypothetical protein P8452_41809 [Trifolium repens]|nr:hypothetical protein P8452_41809 [Trifolium repens]